MKYPIAIHKDKNSCYGVTIPDLPGCFSAGYTLEEARKNAKEAAEFHIETLTESGEKIPQLKPIKEHMNDPILKDAIWDCITLENLN